MSPSSSFSLVARDLARVRGGLTVLDGVDVTVGPRTRLGVVGPNGVGKTTLLRLLAGLDRPDRGSVDPHSAERRGSAIYPRSPSGRSTRRCSSSSVAAPACTRRDAELERAAAALATQAASMPTTTYARALDDYLAAGGPDFEARARARRAPTWGYRSRSCDVPTATLSGGQAARASLAAILVSRFDVFLLDEPTNDLDFAGLARLERFLDELAGGVVVVSHDRTFLERVVSRVLELDEHDRTGTEFGGGWSGYLEARATARRHAEEEYATYRAQRTRLEARARTQRQWAVEGVRKAKTRSPDHDKAQRDFRINASERQASKARATEHALARLDQVEKPWEGWDLRFTVAAARGAVTSSCASTARWSNAVTSASGRWISRSDGPSGWPSWARTARGRRHCCGPCSGICRSLPGSAGSGPGWSWGRWTRRGLPSATTARCSTRSSRQPACSRGEARSLLAKFGLGADHVLRRAATLSPGERTRAVLARFAAQGVNCLVLDEPTNHLDLPAIEQLEAALDLYDGTLLLVSHDRALLDAVRVTRAITANGEPVDP